jgi:amidase
MIMNATGFDPVFATAAEMADAVRAGKVSARELLDATFDRIDRHNPALNAIVWQDRQRAMARARDADKARAQHQSAGALHGVPVTIKESFAYRGSPNTWGLPALKDAISPRTAVAVERLESAGAIVVGKTNMPLMLGDWQSDNEIYGTTNNPWDLARTPGGSTGGGAAAVAAGLGAVTIGSDLSGSIRIPAHFCGVYGHKPSLGLIGMDGFQPGPWDGSPGYPMDIAVVGPLARSANDLDLALDVLAGSSGDDARAWTCRLPPPRHTRLEDFRVGYMFDEKSAPLSSDIVALYEDVVAALSKSGATLTRGWPQGVDLQSHVDTFQFLVMALVTADAGPNGRGGGYDHARWLHETRKRLAFRAVWQSYFQDHDVLLLPTTFTAAFSHDHSQPIERRVVETPEGKRPYLRDMASWISHASLAGLPATVAPIGRTSADLPVGIQIVAPMWEDRTAIAFAALLADSIGGFAPPPAFRD